ncbi:HHL077Cp [Eremothecium sinecaudum]|uniref:pyridoxal kinase n=1 Tax=Eremothecium sinecaudum TaxID=45286 RepID=A0A109V0K4_9SACH|nr:HHL077Cp [Eremothecium sinecaudum]AMD22693.1 HHL077Cp [Eremothecium sinecaudum]
MGKKVLSIQSHVVYGYVGNKAATFPLQYRGWDVDALNTVEYSNHPGHGSYTGSKTKADDISDIILNGLLPLDLDYTAVLLGYLPDAEGHARILEIIRRICTVYRDIILVVDPVLGDNGKLYVPHKTIGFYKQLLTDTTVALVTPNQFELFLLTDVLVTTKEHLKKAIDVFNERYPRVKRLVVTSLRLEETADQLLVLCTDFQSSHYFAVPLIRASFSGCGDLITALLLDAVTEFPGDLSTAVSRALTLIHGVLQASYEYTLRETATEDRNKPLIITDLRLIQSRNQLRDHPAPQFACFRINYP